MPLLDEAATVERTHVVRPLTARRLRPGEALAETIIFAASTISILGVFLIFVFVAREALPLLTSHEIQKEVTLRSLLTTRIWQPVGVEPKYSILPLVVGTLKVTIIAILFATPLAIGGAIYTAEFAPRKVREVVKPFIEILAGFPSVVLGFIALMVLATLLQKITGVQSRLNAFVGGIAVGLAITPVIFTVVEDALTAIPKAFREASLALGATRAQTALSVVVPAAAPGIAAAIILGIGRGIGETMIVLMATGNAAIISWSPFDSTRTMAATIGQEMAEVVFGDAHYTVLFFIGVILFAITFVLNLISHAFVRRITRKLGSLK
jgi:phosphate transport system permease protein